MKVHPVIHYCVHCDVVFFRIVTTIRPRFCSRKCQLANYRRVQRQSDQALRARQGRSMRPRGRIDKQKYWGDIAIRRKMEMLQRNGPT